MTFNVIVEDEAKQDWNKAVDWYDRREPGVGLGLNEKIHALLQTLSEQPERFPLATRLTRKAKGLGRWPYSVYFTIDTERRLVKVLAIWHGKRNPANSPAAAEVNGMQIPATIPPTLDPRKGSEVDADSCDG